MNYLNQESVILGSIAHSKAQALAVVAEHLLAQGFVTGDYTEALLARESQASTYLGQGIAIPHGTLADKDKVAKTGVVLVHFADGVEWGDGQTVYLAVGIAAKSDEHLDVLRQLARSLGDDDVANTLKAAKSADEILKALGQTTSIKPRLNTYVAETSAKDWEAVLVFAHDFLDKQSVVSSGFLTQILSKPLIQLGQGVGFVQSDVGALSPAVLVVGLNDAVIQQNTSVSWLLVVANHKQMDKNKLSDVLDGVLKKPPVCRQDWYRLLGQDHAYRHADVVLVNSHGLHARPANVLSETAKGFDDNIQISLDNHSFVSAKSLVRLLSLGAECGATLYFRTPDNAGAEERLTVMVQAVKSGLGEEIATHVSVSDTEPLVVQDEPALQKNTAYQGLVASRGLCVAPAYVIKEREFVFEQTADDPDEQKRLLVNAIDVIRMQLDAIIKTAKTKDIAEIFIAHQHLLDDEEILAGVYQYIDDGLSAPMAWHREINRLAAIQSKLDNPLLAQRAMDLKDIGQRVLAALCGENLLRPEGSYVLIKDDLLPSDLTILGNNLSAIVTAFGGINSHSAIIARALGIPALVGVGTAVFDIEQGERVLVDAQEGYFMISPDEHFVKDVLDKQAKLTHETNLAKAAAHLPATTADGHRVEVAVNLGDVSVVERALALGAEGVGLLRTEFVFMKHGAMPDIATQKVDYAQVFDVMGNLPVVVRTLDVGGDKPLPYLAMNKEDNPFLGVRGIRLTLQRPDIFKDQLTALIQASCTSANNKGVVPDLRIMFPMIGRLEEWHLARAILDEVLLDNPHPNLQVGMMIEVPSAVAMADKFAKEVDFFSIGTNDLVQYSLAIDRGHPSLSADADGLNPAILRLIKQTVQAAHAHGKWVGVCGELASDELAVPVLLGLGVDELSVSASQIPLIKMQIRKLSLANCQALAKAALNLDTASQVRALIAKESV